MRLDDQCPFDWRDLALLLVLIGVFTWLVNR